MNPQLVLGILLMAIPLTALVWRGEKMFAKEKLRSESPFSEKLLRPAGETLRLKISEIEDKIMELGMLLAVCIIFPGMVVMQAPLEKFSGVAVTCLLIIVISWIAGLILWSSIKKLREQLRNYRLGYDGERYVAAELNPLFSKGYRVFHDFVFDMHPGGEATDFNIDHVVVGPAGIFAIETKAWRKPKAEPVDGHPNHTLVINGDSIKLPQEKVRKKQFVQARRQADRLSEWLTGRSKVKIPVHALLVFPGWWIDNQDGGPVPVRSGKNCAYFFDNCSPSVLPKRELNLIADRIEAHCRNLDSV